MWLLQTTTYKLQHFLDDREVTYAILSHCWADNEVTFQELRDESIIPEFSKDTQGWRKIRAACKQAREDGLEHIWIDTCNIDKTSSAELSEAINSMYRWYQNANICYVHLADVAGSEYLTTSKWFTRGWTLQELIAPKKLIFYNCRWQPMGSRTRYHIAIGKQTGIPLDLLCGDKSVDDYSIAQRMSWASLRVTTRAEDTAYSLMGLFGVNMPMLYGEGGQQAFLRLQEEIIKSSTDQTIFAWKFDDDTIYRGMLAQSPAEFSGCGLIKQARDAEETPFQQSNAGLQISFRVYPFALNTYHVELPATNQGAPIGIFLGFPQHSGQVDRVGRRRYDGHDWLPFPSLETSVRESSWKKFIIPRNPFRHDRPDEQIFGFFIRRLQIPPSSKRGRIEQDISVLAQPGTWNDKTNIVSLSQPRVEPVIALALPDQNNVKWLFLQLGFTEEFEPWAWIFPAQEGERGDIPSNLPVLIEKSHAANSGRFPRPFDAYCDVTRSMSSKPTASECFVNELDFHHHWRKFDSTVAGYWQGSRSNGLNASNEAIRVEIYRSKDYVQGWTVDITPTFGLLVAKKI